MLHRKTIPAELITAGNGTPMSLGDRAFEIGITMVGPISASAYSPNVIDFLF